RRALLAPRGAAPVRVHAHHLGRAGVLRGPRRPRVRPGRRPDPRRQARRPPATPPRRTTTAPPLTAPLPVSSDPSRFPRPCPPPPPTGPVRSGDCGSRRRRGRYPRALCVRIATLRRRIRSPWVGERHRAG